MKGLRAFRGYSLTLSSSIRPPRSPFASSSSGASAVTLTWVLMEPISNFRFFNASEPLPDAEKEEVVLDLRKKGHELQWARDTRLRALKREGWEPVYERDAIGRPTIFTDRLQELVLVHRPSPGQP